MNAVQLVYVFDYREADGYVMRVPAFVARLVCRTRWGKWWDFAPTPEGL